jgi:hypothetical protein
MNPEPWVLLASAAGEAPRVLEVRGKWKFEDFNCQDKRLLNFESLRRRGSLLTDSFMRIQWRPVGGPFHCGAKPFSVFIVASSSSFPAIVSFRLLNLISTLLRCTRI